MYRDRQLVQLGPMVIPPVQGYQDATEPGPESRPPAAAVKRPVQAVDYRISCDMDRRPVRPLTEQIIGGSLGGREVPPRDLANKPAVYLFRKWVAAVTGAQACLHMSDRHTLV